METTVWHRVSLFTLFLIPTLATAAPFTLAFDDLPLGTDVLDSYRPATGASFSSGLIVVAGDVYFNPAGHSAELTATVTLTLDEPQPLISFYAQGPLTIEYYLGPNLVETEVSTQISPWEPLGQAGPFDRVVFIPGGAVKVDAVTSTAFVIPEPDLSWILLGASLAMIVVRSRPTPAP